MIRRFTVRFVSDILAAKRLPAYDNLRITNERPPTPFLILLRVQVHVERVELSVVMIVGSRSSYMYLVLI